uniref:Uncharacterized protein n=1 Tax=Helicotheca tamesis TaxID=374047 RepID=A0A7S2I2K7_9STRA|mmetsp:Transcript_4914/g.6762  ORF Transcript_4914/g.6762 Transcript_4914/m.6762 type:complete len:120 (+) Transcript_4914:83-442(+)
MVTHARFNARRGISAKDKDTDPDFVLLRQIDEGGVIASLTDFDKAPPLITTDRKLRPDKTLAMPRDFLPPPDQDSQTSFCRSSHRQILMSSGNSQHHPPDSRLSAAVSPMRPFWRWLAL